MPSRFPNHALWSALVSRLTPRQSYSVRPMVFVAASLHLMPGPSMPPCNCHKQQSLQIHKSCPLVSFGKQIHATPVVQCTSDGLCACNTQQCQIIQHCSTQAEMPSRFPNHALWSALGSRITPRQSYSVRPMVFVAASLNCSTTATSSKVHRFTNNIPWSALVSRFMPRRSYSAHPMAFVPALLHDVRLSNTGLLKQKCQADSQNHALGSALVSRLTPRQSYSVRPMVFVAASFHLMPGPSMPPCNCHKQQSLQIHKCPVVSFRKQIVSRLASSTVYVRWTLWLHRSTLPHPPLLRYNCNKQPRKSYGARLWLHHSTSCQPSCTALQLPQAATSHRFTNHVPWSAVLSRFMPRQLYSARPMVLSLCLYHSTSCRARLCRPTTATSSNVRFTNHVPWSALVSRFMPRQLYSARPMVFVAASLHLIPGPSMPPYNCHKQQRQIHKSCPLVSFGKQIHASPVVQCTSDGLCGCITPPHPGPVYAALQLPQAAKFTDSQIMSLGQLW